MANLRLFFALELGAAARARAARIAAALREHTGGRDVRWVREESLHVTLRFLGSVDPARVADLAREVGAATRGVAPFAASLAGLELFPSPRRPRVVALGLEPAAALCALAEAVERGAVAAGFAPEARAFRPHLTLGRTRDQRRFRLAADVTASVTAPGESWEVVETVLFCSDLALGGARYAPLARVPLHP
ncbi:MAG TPA: RNA 2',3'-cyclic phosphodiesterase [Myxococcota bacterium]|nr:RNA 2',3'-cyclic phosphodiesterase [Myxococcota bacterium]